MIKYYNYRYKVNMVIYMKLNEYNCFPSDAIEKIKKCVPGKVFYKESTDSTNMDAKLSKNAPDRSVFLAEKQTRGRGRLGREWSSPEGVGIWMSIYLKPQVQIEDISRLTLIAGMAVSRVIKNTVIKWPNDILIGGKKLAGILTEMSAEQGNIKNVIVGIGINVNTEYFPEELQDKATSLYIETGEKFNREEIICDIVNEFFSMYDIFLREGFSIFSKEYTRKCITLGKEVVIIKNEQKSFAKAIRITQQGELVIEINGKEEIVNSSEVSVRGLLGYL